MNKKYFLIFFTLCIMILVSLACSLLSFMDGPTESQLDEDREIHFRQTAEKATATFLKITPDYVWEEEPENAAENEIGIANTPEASNLSADKKLIFNYTGENQSYHTGLRNKTVFYIDYDAGTVTASEEAGFEEPFGSQTSSGTDAVRFNGTYDEVSKSFSGDLNITTRATATGGESAPTTIDYTMAGVLSARLVNDQWFGEVTGSATLTQTWPEGPNSDSVTSYTITWTITGTPVE